MVSFSTNVGGKKLMSTTDKHGANMPRKNDEHNQVCTKTATAEMIRADLGILGAKLPLMNQRKTNKRLDLIETANYERLDIKTNAEEEKMRNQKIEQISLLDHTSMEVDHPSERYPDKNIFEVTDISTHGIRKGCLNVSQYQQSGDVFHQNDQIPS